MPGKIIFLTIAILLQFSCKKSVAPTRTSPPPVVLVQHVNLKKVKEVEELIDRQNHTLMFL